MSDHSGRRVTNTAPVNVQLKNKRARGTVDVCCPGSRDAQRGHGDPLESPSPAAVPIFSPGDLVPETCVDWGRKASEDQIMGME